VVDPAARSPRGRALPSVLRALAHRDYRRFFLGQLVSLVGTWMQSVAQSWLVYRLTGSAVLLGAVGFASQIPVFLLSPVGGVVADRYPRRAILLATQGAMMLLAFALAALTLAQRITVPEIVALAALLGVANGFDVPARQSFLVELVPREDLLNAIALNSSMFNGARIVGPAIAGVLVAAVGEGWCFLANAVSYLAVIAGLLTLRGTRAAPAAHAGALAEIAEGFRFVAATPPIRSLLLLIGVVSLTGVPYVVLMPVVAGDVLHAGSGALGLLMGASGLGALAGALTLARRTTVRGLGNWVANAAFAFGGALVAFSASRRLGLSIALLVPVGYAMMLQMSSSNTLIQSMVPDRLRGRVMSVYSMMFLGMAPFGAMFAGAVAERIGAPWAIAIGGAASVAAALVFRRELPRLRDEGRRLIVAQEELVAAPPDEGAATPIASSTGDAGGAERA
jgi:MFS family permease